MFKLIGYLTFLSVVFSNNIDRTAHITSYVNEVNPDGTYRHSYSGSNGISVQEAGVGGQYATGSAQWYSPEGIPFTLTYTADENGFQAKGDHLPTPPPIPDQILRALEYIRKHPSKGEQRFNRKF